MEKDQNVQVRTEESERDKTSVFYCTFFYDEIKDRPLRRSGRNRSTVENVEVQDTIDSSETVPSFIIEAPSSDEEDTYLPDSDDSDDSNTLSVGQKILSSTPQ